MWHWQDMENKKIGRNLYDLFPVNFRVVPLFRIFALDNQKTYI